MTFYAEPRGGWDLKLSAFSPTCESASHVTDTNAAHPGGAAILTLPVTPGVPIYLIVDGPDGGKGEYIYTLLAYSRDDPLCQVIVAPRLGVVQNVNRGRGLPADRKTETHATHQVNAPSPCHREYLVPWPRSVNTPTGLKFLWITDARVKKGGAPRSMNTPASAEAIAQLKGQYTVLPKRPEDAGKGILCWANFVLHGNQWLKSNLPLGLSVSIVKARILVTPFPALAPFVLESTKSCISSQGAPFLPFPACEIGAALGESVNVPLGPVPGTVPLGVPQTLDFLFISRSARLWDALATATLTSFDFHLQCPDPPTEGQEDSSTYAPVEFAIEEVQLRTPGSVLP
jgi:hypothetical protein